MDPIRKDDQNPASNVSVAPFKEGAPQSGEVNPVVPEQSVEQVIAPSYPIPNPGDDVSNMVSINHYAPPADVATMPPTPQISASQLLKEINSLPADDSARGKKIVEFRQDEREEELPKAA
jgi:hypothetical protein